MLVALMIAFGWRSLFHVTGAFGIAFALLFLMLYRNPVDSKRLSKDELAYIEAGGGECLNARSPPRHSDGAHCSRDAVCGA